MKHTVAATMRNEGPFILEWVAWQKMLGFDDILILFNDCTDRSERLLRKLARYGHITTLQHQPPKGRHPKSWAHEQMAAHPLVKGADWLFLCDVDEFLVIHIGEGRVQDLLGPDEPDVAGIGINWKCFGDNGIETWEDGLVHRSFLKGAPLRDPANTSFKSFIWQPRRWGRFAEHTPRFWRGAGPWNEGHNRWVLGDGTWIEDYEPDVKPKTMVRPPLITHSAAQVNHYIIRTQEQWAFKRGRPSASRGVDRYDARFEGRYNKSLEEDPSALAYAERFDAIHAELCAIPGMMRLHHLCCADYIAAMCEKRGDDPTRDVRFARHMELAEN